MQCYWDVKHHKLCTEIWPWCYHLNKSRPNAKTSWYQPLQLLGGDGNSEVEPHGSFSSHRLCLKESNMISAPSSPFLFHPGPELHSSAMHSCYDVLPKQRSRSKSWTQTYKIDTKKLSSTSWLIISGICHIDEKLTNKLAEHARYEV